MELNACNNKSVDSHTFHDDKVINIEDLSVWTPEEKSWWRWKSYKSRNVILNNITECIHEGEFLAVLGPSGAGKTTFLVSVAGKSTLPSTGNVTINGRNVKEMKGIVEIVPQVEVFMDSLSVMEHLIFTTEMKLGSYKKHVNRVKLNTLIEEFKLKAHVMTTIGALSGGEKRLLSLASQLLSNPEIIICDEPTTGLDSYSAMLVISILKRLVTSGKIVICSVHQPSSDLFKEFNSILLMSEGKLLFHGTQDECRLLFESVNLYCPKTYNPAEFYIRAVSSNPHNENYVERILEVYHNRSYESSSRYNNYEESGSDTSVTSLMQFKLTRRNWFKQVQLLIWRSSLTLKRDIREHILQLFISVMISALIISTCYVGISGTTQRGVQDFRGLLWLLCSEVSFSLSYNALYVFEQDLTLFRREVGMYSGSAFFVSRFLGFIPRCVIWPITFVIIATLAVELPNRIITAMEFSVALIATAIAATAYGLGMGALFTSTGVIADVMPTVDLPLFLMSGAFLRVSSLPLWLHPIKYISHFYYGMDAVSNIYWRHIDYIDCPANATGSCVKNGISVLIENGYSFDFILQDSIGLLLVTLTWSFVGYYGLKREEKKGYAY